MPKPVKPVKIVLMVGHDLPMEEIREQILKEFPELQDQIIFLGDGKKKVSELDLKPIKGKTNEETLFIVYAHGEAPYSVPHNFEGTYASSGSFLQNLREVAGHRITVDMASCHSGALLKRDEVKDENISVLTEASHKYHTLTLQNTKSVIESIRQKLLGVTNKKVFAQKIGSRPETLYFLPFKNEVVGGLESKSDSASEPKVPKTKYKFSRPGKFTRKDIKQVLIEFYGEKGLAAAEIDQRIAADLEKFKDIKKSDFSLYRIQFILNLSENSEEKASSNSLLSKFREKLQNKFTEPEIKSYFQKRQRKFDKISGNNNPTAIENIDYNVVMADFWFLAITRNSKSDYSEEISAILKNNPDFANITDGNKSTALHYAVEANNLEIVKKLIKFTSNINCVNKYGDSPLMIAARQGNWKIFKLLIEEKANVNLINPVNGKSALIYAAQSGNSSIVEELINYGAKINYVDKYRRSALICAAEKCQFEIVKQLIDNKANIGLVDEDGNSAITHIAEFGDFGIIKELIIRKLTQPEVKNLEDVKSSLKDFFAGKISSLVIIEELISKELINSNIEDVKGALLVIEDVFSGISNKQSKIFELFTRKNQLSGIVQNITSSAKVTVDNLENIVQILKEDRSKYGVTSNYFDFLSYPNQYYPLISRILMNVDVKDKKVIELLNKNLDLFINDKNLAKPDSDGKIPLSIVIEKAASAKGDSRKILIQIAANLVTKMELVGPEGEIFYDLKPSDKMQEEKKDEIISAKKDKELQSKQKATGKVIKEVSKFLGSKEMNKIKKDWENTSKDLEIKSEKPSVKPDSKIHPKTTEALEHKVNETLL